MVSRFHITAITHPVYSYKIGFQTFIVIESSLKYICLLSFRALGLLAWPNNKFGYKAGKDLQKPNFLKIYLFIELVIIFTYDLVRGSLKS